MATYLDYLASDQSNQDYYAQDPFYQAGIGILKTPQPKYKTNTEALLGPMLQGLFGGGMMGFGQANATRDAWEANQQNPYLKALSSPLGAGVEGPLTQMQAEIAPTTDYRAALAPSNWTPNVGRTDSIIAQEQETKKKALRDALLHDLMQQDPNAGIEAAKNMGVDFGVLPPIEDTSKDLRKQQMAEIQARFEDTQDKKKAEVSFPGYEYDINKVRPTSAEAAKVRTELENNAILKTSLEALKGNIDKNGFMKLFGNDAQLQAALKSFIFNTQRKATGSGARLEGPEAKMLQAMTPAVASGDFSGAIKAALFDRSPSQLASDMINVINKSQDAAMWARYKAKRVVDEGEIAAQAVSGSMSGGVPGIGSTYNGEKVLSVKKIR